MVVENIYKVRERIKSACLRAGRDPNVITIVAVSKGRGPEQISEVLAAGITDIGENRIQEAILKINQLRANSKEFMAIKWHMVGHLQSNKVKDAVKIFDLIHSVDSQHLAEAINRQAEKINKIQDILIEVKTSSEETKFGLRPDEASKVFEKIAALKNIRIQGLMTIAPLVSNPGEARPYFRALRELKDRINELRATSFELNILSMGMSDDFEVAIEEGATMIRLGRVIFE